MKKEYVVGFFLEGTGAEFPEDVYVVLIRKSKPLWQVERLNGIGGKIEPGELPINAMAREWYEETGTMWTSWGALFTLQHPDPAGKNEYTLYGFFTTSNDTRASELLHGRLVSGEGVIEICNARHLPDAIIGNLRWMIGLALDADISKPVLLNDNGGN